MRCLNLIFDYLYLVIARSCR